MTQYDVSENMSAALTRLGGQEPWVLVGLGEFSAFPHGSVKPQKLHEGDIVLIDAGCSFRGIPVRHHPDHGVREADRGDRSEVWNLERRAQDAALPPRAPAPPASRWMRPPGK